MSLMPKA